MQFLDEHVLIQHVSQYVIYESLENSQGIGEAKGDDQVLLVSSGPDQMIVVAEFQLGENRRPLKQFEGRSDEWEGPVLFSNEETPYPSR